MAECEQYLYPPGSRVRLIEKLRIKGNKRRNIHGGQRGTVVGTVSSLVISHLVYHVIELDNWTNPCTPAQLDIGDESRIAAAGFDPKHCYIFTNEEFVITDPPCNCNLNDMVPFREEE